MITADPPVTAETIADKQIRELRLIASEDGEGLEIGDDYFSPAVVLTMCDEAAGTFDYGATFAHLPMARALLLVEKRRQWSRGRLAAAWNARHGGRS